MMVAKGGAVANEDSCVKLGEQLRLFDISAIHFREPADSVVSLCKAIEVTRGVVLSSEEAE